MELALLGVARCCTLPAGGGAGGDELTCERRSYAGVGAVRKVEMGLLQGTALVYIEALILATVDESSRLEDTESREERVGGGERRGVQRHRESRRTRRRRREERSSKTPRVEKNASEEERGEEFKDTESREERVGGGERRGVQRHRESRRTRRRRREERSSKTPRVEKNASEEERGEEFKDTESPSFAVVASTEGIGKVVCTSHYTHFSFR